MAWRNRDNFERSKRIEDTHKDDPIIDDAYRAWFGADYEGSTWVDRKHGADRIIHLVGGRDERVEESITSGRRTTGVCLWNCAMNMMAAICGTAGLSCNPPPIMSSTTGYKASGWR